MKTFSCAWRFIGDINKIGYKGIAKMKLNFRSAAKKAQAAIIALPMFFAFNLSAQNASKADIAMVTTPGDKVKTELKTNAKSVTVEKKIETIREGSPRDAEKASLKDKNVLHIGIMQGTHPEKYTAKQYAEMLQKMFKMPKYAGDYPMDVIVYYKNTDGKYGAKVGVYSGAYSFDKDGGLAQSEADFIMHPYEVAKRIEELAKWHAERQGLQPVIGSDNSVGMANDNP